MATNNIIHRIAPKGPTAVCCLHNIISILCKLWVLDNESVDNTKYILIMYSMKFALQRFVVYDRRCQLTVCLLHIHIQAAICSWKCPNWRPVGPVTLLAQLFTSKIVRYSIKSYPQMDYTPTMISLNFNKLTSSIDSPKINAHVFAIPCRSHFGCAPKLNHLFYEIESETLLIRTGGLLVNIWVRDTFRLTMLETQWLLCTDISISIWSQQNFRAHHRSTICGQKKKPIFPETLWFIECLINIMTGHCSSSERTTQRTANIFFQQNTQYRWYIKIFLRWLIILARFAILLRFSLESHTKRYLMLDRMWSFFLHSTSRFFPSKLSLLLQIL